MTENTRKEALENMLNDYPVSLDTDTVSKILDCCYKKAFQLQKDQKLPSYLLDSESKKKVYKTTKVDLINYMLTNKGEQND